MMKMHSAWPTMDEVSAANLQARYLFMPGQSESDRRHATATEVVSYIDDLVPMNLHAFRADVGTFDNEGDVK